MYEDGYSNLHCIDLSYYAIKMQTEEYKDRYSNIKFQQMDVRNLEYKDSSFDVVIDKALLDALICGGGAIQNT